MSDLYYDDFNKRQKKLKIEAKYHRAMRVMGILIAMGLLLVYLLVNLSN